MKISETFGSSYLTAADVPQPTLVTINGAVAHTFPDETKPKLVVAFAEKQKQLACNKINRQAIVAMHGDDTQLWQGKQVVLYATTTDYAGKTVPCIRVREPQQVPAPQLGTYSEPVESQKESPTPAQNEQAPWA